MNNFAFRFKQTKKADFPKVEHFQMLELLRFQVNGFNQQQCLKGNLEQCAKQEIIHSEYVGYLGNLLKVRTLPQIEFHWNDSYEPNKFVQALGFHYEYVSQLYNLGILYYHIAVNTKTIREQIDNIRYSLWCFMQLKDFLVYVNQKTKEQFSDLSIVHIQMLINYISAFGLDNLYDKFINNCQNIEEKIDCFRILNEAIKNLENACRNLLQSKICNKKEIPPLIHDSLLKLFRFKIVLTETKLFVDIAKHLESTALEVSANENHMGKALAYLKKARESVDNYFNIYEEEGPQRQLLIDSITSTNEEFLQKNSQIHRQSIAKEYELLVLKPKSDFLKSKIPLKIQSLLSLEQPPKQIGGELVLQLTEVIRTKKDQIHQNYLQLQGNFENMNYLYKVQYMMDAYANANQIGLTPTIQRKVALIQDQGGWKGLQAKISKIKKFQEESHYKIKNMKSLIQQYETIQVPEGEGVWLKNKNIDHFKRVVEQMEERLQEASIINDKVLQPIDKAKDQIHFVEQSNNAMIASRLQQSMNESQQFYRENIINLRKLSLLLETIKNKFTIIKAQLFQVDKFIDSLKLQEMNEIEEDRFKIINQQFEQFIQGINQIVSAIELAEIENLAKQLYQNMKVLTIANQDEAQFEEKLKVIVDAFTNLQYAEMFYDSIFQQIEGLEYQIINIQTASR